MYCFWGIRKRDFEIVNLFQNLTIQKFLLNIFNILDLNNARV